MKHIPQIMQQRHRRRNAFNFVPHIINHAADSIHILPLDNASNDATLKIPCLRSEPGNTDIQRKYTILHAIKPKNTLHHEVFC
jgi:hypothetical protein